MAYLRARDVMGWLRWQWQRVQYEKCSTPARLVGLHVIVAGLGDDRGGGDVGAYERVEQRAVLQKCSPSRRTRAAAAAHEPREPAEQRPQALSSRLGDAPEQQEHDSAGCSAGAKPSNLWAYEMNNRLHRGHIARAPAGHSLPAVQRAAAATAG